ncbi:translesion DNA synthesis-associated protein ImuA [Vibrio caribbeanicus]|uniref:RecA-like N-terminal domain-containing protein n=1 Tax=Vibrio caribbeanicus ATCC BAA-2122 TaxID=796620 RepID=E3BHR4_9VIBR|nr:translesion DNA synthesis-associated protein ImuA [Vibrio caribbeanicus]EFP97353.1 hypothetical protein VIBC2010_18199 [Vibrio caribbeanicus ATCC BAA-2122]
MYELIENLKEKQWLRSGSLNSQELGIHPTGHKKLDSTLNGGFPKHGVIEVKSPSGIGELRLLLPHIKNTSQDRLCVFIQPPGYLCTEQLVSLGINANNILLIYPENEQHALWAAEQCLRSGACSNVLLWHAGLEIHQAKRLQVASERGQCLHFYLKTGSPESFSLPITLNMTLSPHDLGLEVSITRRKGGWLNERCIVDMTSTWPELTVEPANDALILPFPMHQRG